MKPLLRILPSLFLLFAFGCTSPDSSSGGTAMKSLLFKQVESSQIPQEVRRELESWTSPQATAKLVSDRYIIVGIGERPTGGYEVRVTKVSQQGTRLHIHAEEIPPPKEMLVTQVITYPHAVIQLSENVSASQIDVTLSKSR